ncbi:MAG: NAD(P)-dependent oxidoreductase [Ramlibacter sp.]
MARIALLGATGSLGSHVARQALQAGHDLSVFVRTPARLDLQVAARARVVTGDLLQSPQEHVAGFIAGHDVLISCAGLVTEGQRFVDLFDRVVGAAEAADGDPPPVCWFLAGAGLLDIDANGRRGLDLPLVRATYWPHLANYERLRRSRLDWRLLCPGPMVQGPGVGLEHLRMSVEVLPALLPPWCARLPDALVLPLFARRIPEMIIPYTDAASYLLAHLAPDEPLAGYRVGLALPRGMKGSKEHWTAQPRGRT